MADRGSPFAKQKTGAVADVSAAVPIKKVEQKYRRGFLFDLFAVELDCNMKKLQYRKYIEEVADSQQLRFKIDEKIHIKVSSFVRQASTQLEELDYTELYRAYSEEIRKSQVEPKVLFKILVCAYLKGIYSSRKIEELCHENVQFIWLLGDQRCPDHCAIARFRSGKTTQKAIEGLFCQYAALLEQRGCTEHNEVFIEGNKQKRR